MEKYDLTPEEYENCLRRAELAIFMGEKSTKHTPFPISLFVVAQPGAGKTGLRTYVEQRYPKIAETCIEFNPDEISMYHKYYEEILNEFPNESYQRLQKFTRPALDTYLRSKAVQLRKNIIQEGTLASTQGYVDILRFQKNGGIANIGDTNEQGEKKQTKVLGGVLHRH